ncbi:MAG TPA: DUF2586 family protein, partial [Deinococcales bacterium]|nr:DUF2586 family protein [Deinococcales bacterium]
LNKVSIAYPLTGRIARTAVSQDVGRVRNGPLIGVTKLEHDETANPGLDALGFITMRSLIGRAGFFATDGSTMSGAGSDFALLTNRQVMDVACSVARDRALEYLNDSVRVNPQTGFIAEVDAKGIEADITAAVKAALVDLGDATDASVKVHRDNNILATGTLLIDVSVIPLAYAKTITLTVGLVNPAMRPAAPAPAAGQK